MENVLFDGWKALGATLIAAPLLYALVVVGVRLSGKRTTGQMNNFDWIVTVAIGSITASGIVIDKVSVAEAGLAITLLLGMQWSLTKLTQRSRRADQAVKAAPRLLVLDGVILDEALSDERVTRDEVMAKLRGQGIARLSEVGAVILENDGTFSVLHRQETDRGTDDDVLPEDLRAA